MISAKVFSEADSMSDSGRDMYAVGLRDGHQPFRDWLVGIPRDDSR